MNRTGRDIAVNKEKEIRNRFENTYRALVSEFFDKLMKLKISDDELNSYQSLFLPSCGTEYANQRMKIAVVGRSTNGWHDSLKEDLVRYFAGGYEMEFGFEEFQKKGPPKWNNQFWKYVEQFLLKVYGEWNVPTQGGNVFSTIAWGNRFAIEPVSNGVMWKQLSELADECGLTSLDNFIEVFQPNAIVYLCHNKTNSDTLLKGCVYKESRLPKNDCKWVLKSWKMKDVFILQSQHSSWLRYQHILKTDFGKIAGAELVSHCDIRP